MLNLITGMPGSGKTCYSLKFMLLEVAEGRPLFVHGVTDLTLNHTPVVCEHPKCRVCRKLDETEFSYYLADEWHLWAPEGAVLFYDECQFIYPARSSNSESLISLTTSRHDGLDFFFLTQHPGLIDSDLKNLVSRHIHLLVNWAGRQQFEWSECQSNPKYTRDATKSSYKLDKKMFALYKSAVLHTKQARKTPYQLYLLGVCLVLFCLFSYRIYSSRFSKKSESTVINPQNTQNSALSSSNSSKNKIDDKFNIKPVIPNLAESAPAYTNLVRVNNYPIITACLQFNFNSKITCKCYTQQGTLYPTSQERCLAFIDNQIFNGYQQSNSGGNNFDFKNSNSIRPPALATVGEAGAGGRIE